MMPHLGSDQQIRHLKRDGWNLITPRGGKHRLDPYKLSPSFARDYSRKAKVMKATDFEDIKKAHDYRCVSCGGQEGIIDYRYDEPIKLEQGHLDPEKPHVIGNIIPQCQFCNKTYKSDFTFDEKGRVRAVASINPIKRASKIVQKKTWDYLRDKHDDEY